ncbi:hypothetical protein GQ457_13G028830 [Hibiscus cannabinus]
MGDFSVRRRRWESSVREHYQNNKANNKTTTVYVSNLPPRLHWQGLWFAFARHGEVVDAFIPLKKNRSGSRFGFVRFSNLENAQRAIVKPTISKNVAPSEKPHHSPHEEFVVEGLIDKGVLEKLNKGLREFDVRQIAGNQFLIDFDKEEMLSHCLKWEFQWLSDIFSNIVRWNEELSPGSRQTWDPSKKGDLDGCYGVSGDSESKCSDENLSSSPVNVFSGQIKNLDSLERSRDGKKLEITDSLTPTKVDMHEDFVGGCSLNLEATNSMVGPEVDLLIVGDRVNDSKHTPSCSSKPHAVAPSLKQAAEGIFQQDLATAQSVGGVVSSQPFGVSRAAEPQLSLIVAESLLSGSPLRVDLDTVVNNEIVFERALEDVQAMGLLNDNIVEECEMVSNYNDISWAARVDKTNGNMDAIERDEACKNDQTSFFPELQDHQFRRKFISLAEMQDQFLSTKEKKKKDRALKKFKKTGQAVAPKEAEVHILTDSDIARN